MNCHIHLTCLGYLDYKAHKSHTDHRVIRVIRVIHACRWQLLSSGILQFHFSVTLMNLQAQTLFILIILIPDYKPNECLNSSYHPNVFRLRRAAARSNRKGSAYSCAGTRAIRVIRVIWVIKVGII